jgi:ankyrin repeat protein
MEHNVGGKTAADVFENPALRQLAQAACRGDASAVGSAVRAGTNPNGVGLDGTTTLVWAVSCDSTAGVQALLAAGANPDLPIGNRFSSVVYVAANRDDPGPLKALLEAGADANVYDLKSERTGIGEALLRGIHKGDWRHWELLLNQVDINRPYNKFGKTIAIYAANFNQFERVVQLLERGYRYRLSELGRAVEVAENLTEPFATWQRKAIDMLKTRGVVFPVGPTKVQFISDAELQKLPANRR